MSALDELLATSRPRHRGCPLCGEKNAALVSVRIQRLNESGNYFTGRGNSHGRAISMCEQHAVEAFTNLTAQLEGK